MFTTKFNLGFASIKTDRCSDCVTFSNKMKFITDQDLKRTLVVEQMIHIRKSKAFFQQLNLKSENSITINFDMMQNQPLPKTQIGEAYYKRQIWYYLLGVIICDEQGKLNHENVFFYRWLESDGGRGCTEITSCLWHFFKTNIINRNIKNIRVFSDSCSSQNKNYSVLLMLLVLAWKYKIYIEWYFPERGHSYMPADRAFGILEKKLRKCESILFPHEYDDLVKSVGTLYTVPRDCKWLNWQEITKDMVKSNKTFKITEAKHLTLDCATASIGLADSYSLPPTCEHTILKRGRKLANIEGYLKEVPCSNHIKSDKIEDVKFLLNKMGYEMENVLYYKDALQGIQDNLEDSE